MHQIVALLTIIETGSCEDFRQKLLMDGRVLEELSKHPCYAKNILDKISDANKRPEVKRDMLNMLFSIDKSRKELGYYTHFFSSPYVNHTSPQYVNRQVVRDSYFGPMFSTRRYDVAEYILEKEEKSHEEKAQYLLSHYQGHPSEQEIIKSLFKKIHPDVIYAIRNGLSQKPINAGLFESCYELGIVNRNSQIVVEASKSVSPLAFSFMQDSSLAPSLVSIVFKHQGPINPKDFLGVEAVLDPNVDQLMLLKQYADEELQGLLQERLQKHEAERLLQLEAKKREQEEARLRDEQRLKQEQEQEETRLREEQRLKQESELHLDRATAFSSEEPSQSLVYYYGTNEQNRPLLDIPNKDKKNILKSFFM